MYSKTILFTSAADCDAQLLAIFAALGKDMVLSVTPFNIFNGGMPAIIGGAIVTIQIG